MYPNENPETLPEQRRGKLKKMIETGEFIRIIEVHSGISSILAEKAAIDLGEKGRREFHGFWASSLTDSALRGVPDISMVGQEARLHIIQEIFHVTSKLLIYDGDTGGETAFFESLCRKLECIGVSGVIIEDKVFPKRNSLEAGTIQNLEEPGRFAEKIKRGKGVLRSDDFLIFARIESFIAGLGLEDAVRRAEQYLDAGADGIMIHSRCAQPDEVISFAERYHNLVEKYDAKKPLICVPTTYNSIYEKELQDNGFDIIIYANHLLRASVRSMRKMCRNILINQRTLDVEPYCESLQSIFSKVGFLDLKERDSRDSLYPLAALIPAAGKPKGELTEKYPDTPICDLPVNGRNIFQIQSETFLSAGVRKIHLVLGYGREYARIPKNESITLYENRDYEETQILNSLFQAEEAMENGFILSYADILFSRELLDLLLHSEEDIVLVVDNSLHVNGRMSEKPGIETVTVEKPHHGSIRRLAVQKAIVQRIGLSIHPDDSTHEFVGIALFSAKGADFFRKVYHECRRLYDRDFRESESFEKALITDIVQEIIQRDFPVYALEVNRGWMEIQSESDILLAEDMLGKQE